MLHNSEPRHPGVLLPGIRELSLYKFRREYPHLGEQIEVGLKGYLWGKVELSRMRETCIEREQRGGHDGWKAPEAALGFY